MNLAETHALLTYAAAVDNRRFDDATVLAWQEILADLRLDDCRRAVTRHFATAGEYLMPVHIRRGAEEIDYARRRDERLDREAAVHAALEAVPRTERGRELVDAVRALLPAGDPDKLRWGHRQWRELQRDAQRQRDAVPNPHYDPTAVAQLAAKETTDAA